MTTEVSGNCGTNGWTRCYLGDREVSTIVMGQSPESSTYNSIREGLPFFQGKADFGLRHPTARSWCSAPTRTAEPGDILLSVRAPVGDVNIALERSCIGRGLAAIRPGPRTLGEFLFYLLLHHKSDLDALGSGAIFKAINKDALHDFAIALPSLSEQQAVTTVLMEIHRTIEVQDRIVATLKELKAATMAKLFREGLRGEPLKQTEIGEIPKSWEMLQLGQVVDIVYGVQAAVANLRDASIGTPILTNVNITNNGALDLTTLRYYGLSSKEREKLILRKGDVLFNWRSGSPHHVGKTALFDKDGEYTFSSFILRFRPTARINNAFLFYYLQNIKAQGFFVNRRQQSSVNSVFNASISARIPVVLPTLSVQREIAAKLQRIDEKVRMAPERRDATHRLFATMLHLLMSGQVRLTPGAEFSGERAQKQEHPDPLAGSAGIPERLREAIERFVAELVRRHQPDRVVLFGSVVPGSPDARAEVGLLVVMPFEGRSLAQAVRIEHEIEHDFPLEIVVRRPEEVERAVEIGNSDIKGILERGRPLYTRPGAGTADRRPEAPRQERPPRRGKLREETLREIVQRIVAAVAPEQIILFGSAARGEMGPDSDVDLMVVTACTARRETARTIRWHLIGVAPGLPKDVVVVTPEQVARQKDTIGLIIRPALREGRVVYGA